MSVLSGVPQRSMLGQVLFNYFISGVDSGIEYTLSKFADKTKVCDAADTPEAWDAIHSDLDNFKEWVNGNLMRCKTTKWKVLHLDCSNPWYEHRLDDELIESQEWLGSHDLGVGGWEAGYKPPICSCSPERQLNPCCIKRRIARRSRGVVLPLPSTSSMRKVWESRGFFMPGKRRLWGNLNMDFWYLKGAQSRWELTF